MDTAGQRKNNKLVWMSPEYKKHSMSVFKY
jgi:hypothetical protein